MIKYGYFDAFSPLWINDSVVYYPLTIRRTNTMMLALLQNSFVSLFLRQTSNLGQAYIVKGGINQHLISIVVEAYNTYVFNVFAYVYGV